MSRPETSPERAGPTPGPWFVGAQNDALYIIDRRPAHNNDYPNHDADTHSVARVFDVVRGEDVGAANAALLAAAPALLAALQQVVEMFGPGIDAGQSPTLDAARAAIAAATGSAA